MDAEAPKWIVDESGLVNAYVGEWRYGLEIPALNGITGKEFYDVIIENRPLIEKVGDFLKKNGVIDPFAGHPQLGGSLYGVGVIIHPLPDREKVDIRTVPSGVTFFGSEQLARKLAAAFPQNRVLREDGLLIPPTQPKADRPVKPRRPAIGP